MKVTCFRQLWALPLAALLGGLPAAYAQQTAEQPVVGAQLITTIEAAPISPVEEDLAATTDDEAESPVDPADEAAVETAEEETGEIIRERYSNGAVRIEREMTQDAEGNYIRHGIYREYDPKGLLLVEGRFANGARNGVWRKVHAGSEPIFATAPYKDFKGPFISQVNFSDNVLHGKWIIADSRQRKISEIEFDNGDRHGKAAWYYPNGVLMTQLVYDHGRVHGDVVKWGSDSTVVAKENYQNGRKLAPRLEFYSPQQKKSEVTYLHAMLFMRTPDDWDKATLATFETRGQDERHGPFMTWHPNGQLARQGEYRYNLPVGKVVYWYNNGQKQMDGAYVDGKQDGKWTWWHGNGQKSIAGQYNAGNPIGKWTWWKDDGKVAQKADLSVEKPGSSLAGSQPSAEPDREAVQLIEPGQLLK